MPNEITEPAMQRQDYIPLSANDNPGEFRQHGNMHDKMRQMRKARGLTFKEIAEALDTDAPQIWKLEHGVRRMTYEWATMLAPVLGCSPLDLLGDKGATERPVTIIGFIKDTEEIHEFGDKKEHFAPFPFSDARSPAAVAVHGAGMWPVYEEGDTLFIDRETPIDEALGRQCVVKTTHYGTLIRRLMPGTAPKKYRLVSHRQPEISDVEVAWAYPIIWIRR